jgi:hypothetical protein
MWAPESVGRSEHVEELLASQPLATPDALLFDDRDVRRWAAEGRQAKPQEEHRDLAQTGEPGHRQIGAYIVPSSAEGP